MKSDGSGVFLTLYDLQIGSDVIIFGKNIRLNDCDQYTREFFENLGLP